MTARSLRFSAPAVQAEINVTPLIDVMLALVMILMLTAPLALHKLSLPLAGSNGQALPKTLMLSVKSTGELYLDGIAISRAQLAVAFAAAAAAASPALLEVHPEATTRYDDVATVLALARNNGMDAIRVEGVRSE
ncbi:MAG: biopolymer transporter ExbD [Dokdonella sp.]